MKSFNEVLYKMKAHQMSVPGDKISFSIDITKDEVINVMQMFIPHPVWIDPYDEILKWFNDNQGRGLFMYGHHGLGKTVFAKYVIPAILLEYERKVVRYYDMNYINQNIDEVLKRRIISIDDIGVESPSYDFGNKRFAFPEIIDAVEKENKLAIITTNLNADQLKEFYGERVFDRILSTTKRVLFTGKSFRS